MANGAPPMIASLCLIMAIASLIPLAILARVIPIRGVISVSYIEVDRVSKSFGERVVINECIASH